MMRVRAAGALRARRIGGCLVAIVLTCLGAAPNAPAATPDWVETSGRSRQYPAERWVTGYGQARGRDAEARARQAAVAALAQAVEVRVEFELEDDREGSADHYDERVAALTRTSSAIELRDVRFEVWRGDRRVHALAMLERSQAGARRRKQRDRALVRAEACLADAELARETGDAESAERRLAQCRTAHAQAIRHDTVSSALTQTSEPNDDAPVRLERVAAHIERAERATADAPPASLAEAADRIADQLQDQRLGRPRRLELAPLVDAGTDLPSPFGQAAATEIERALVVGWNGSARARHDPRRLDLSGTHLETNDGVRLTVVVREFGTGTLVASAAVTLPGEAVPTGLALRPPNWEPALEQREKLAPPPEPEPAPSIEPGPRDEAPPLRVELWTDRGRDHVSYTEGESIRVFMRVNDAAWVRLVYVLSNGLTVPIEDALFVGRDQAHTAIAYPGRLEVVPPFGVEMLHAAAFEERPPPLPTRSVEVAGERYEVVREGVEALVRARGVRVAEGLGVAEDVLTVTTLAASTGSEWRVRTAE